MPGAQKTVAYQMNSNLLLSEDAIVDTKPQLEIFADDVKCAHGGTVGQLDEAALFYLRSRGVARGGRAEPAHLRVRERDGGARRRGGGSARARADLVARPAPCRRAAPGGCIDDRSSTRSGRTRGGARRLGAREESAPRRFDAERARADSRSSAARPRQAARLPRQRGDARRSRARSSTRSSRYYETQNANVHRGVHLLSERATKAYEDARATASPRFLGARTRTR